MAIRMESERRLTRATDLLIVSIPETAGSALYGMLDVLSAAGSIGPALLRSPEQRTCFRVRILSPDGRWLTRGNRNPVNPDCSVVDDPHAPIVIVPELYRGAVERPFPHERCDP